MPLNSTSVIKLVDLISEGPIQGLVGGRKGIYLEETALKVGNTDNYSTDEVDYDFRLGGRTQGDLPQNRAGASNIVDINQEIGENYNEELNTDNEVISRTYGSGDLVRSITDLDADKFSCLFTVPALFSTAVEGLARGQRFNATITIRIYLQSKGKGFNEVYEKELTGIATNNYQFQTPQITLSGTGPWNIKVKKFTNAENDFEITWKNFKDLSKAKAKKLSLAQGRGNRIFWTSLVEQVNFYNTYPYTAVAGLEISTKVFSSVPTRAYKVKGRKVLIPDNATVQSDGYLTFEGAFSGATIGPKWTTCPVCCYIDMLTNERYGAGQFVSTSNINWVDLYPLIKYANQLISTPDGKEPRFAINTVIGNQTDAYSCLQDLSSVFRGMMYWASNTIQTTADHGNYDGSDISPVHLYTNSNVINGAFEYSGTSLKTRSSSVRVRYQDPENLYKSNWVVVENYELIDRYGYQVKEILAFGATSKWQAQRMGKWLMAAEELDGETVTFSAGLDGAVVLPGQVFAVADEVRAGVRLAGRVASGSTTTAIKVDQSITLPSGSSHKLTCKLPDGSVEEKNISTVSGTQINVTSAFSAVPQDQSVWSLSSTTINEQKFRCVSVSNNADNTFTIVGAQHNDSIYGVADGNETLEFQDVTRFDEAPAKPIDLTLLASLVQKNDNTVNRITAEWSRGLNGNTISFEIRYRVGKGNWKRFILNEEIYEIDGLNEGSDLTFQVRAIGPVPIERKSNWISKGIEVPIAAVVDPVTTTGEETAAVTQSSPPDPENVTVEAISGDEVILRWDIPDKGTINPQNLTAIIRHATETDGTGTWANSTKLSEVSAITTYALLNLIEGEYLIKFDDKTSKLKSANAKSATIDLPDPVAKLLVQTDREDTDTPPFDGQHNDIFYSDTSGMVGLVLDGDELFDSVADVDLIPVFDFTGDRLESGEYFFKNVLDLGGKFSVDLKRRLKAVGVYPSDLWDGRSELIDRWSDVDGLNADDVSATMYFRTADEAITDDDYLLETGDKLLEEDSDKIMYEDNVLYGAWIPLESGRYKGRVFQFKVNLTSNHIDQTPVVSEAGYTVDISPRTEASATIASGTSAKAVTFTNAFYQTPNVGITSANLATGDYYAISSLTRTGFTINFLNSSGSNVDRNFVYQAVGYGKQES